MAQWLGQFTGRTHRTAVLDAHELMQHAVAAFINANPAEKPKKAKAVRTLAKRLLTTRVRFLKARLSAATDPALDEVLAEHAHEIARLEQALSALVSGGVAEILREFSVQEASKAPEGR